MAVLWALTDHLSSRPVVEASLRPLPEAGFTPAPARVTLPAGRPVGNRTAGWENEVARLPHPGTGTTLGAKQMREGR